MGHRNRGRRAADQWAREGLDQLLQQHIEDARQLAGILRLRIGKGVPLVFL
ncbi:hypothetical protein [Streptomyces sp. NPDC058718]|uniref:hypothetical protein n=1 Tax=Streptomyces sp. NPDC058718 TaxID=3346610 RepID=UPI0036ADDAF3